MTAVLSSATFHPDADVVLDLRFASEHERLTARRAGVGSSDIAQILGVSKYGTPRDLWEDKTGRRPVDTTTSEAAEWGQTLEPVISAKFAQRHGVDPVHLPFILARRDKPWHMASPDDGVVKYGRPVLVEIKNRRFDSWDGVVPDDIEMQVQWQLHVMGLDQAYVVVLFGGQEMPPPFQVLRNQDHIDELVEHVDRFWGHVQMDVPPPLMAADTKSMTPAESAVTLDGAQIETVAEIDRLKAEKKRLDVEIDRLADPLRVALADAETGVTPDGRTVVTYSPNKNGVRTLKTKAHAA